MPPRAGVVGGAVYQSPRTKDDISVAYREPQCVFLEWSPCHVKDGIGDAMDRGCSRDQWDGLVTKSVAFNAIAKHLDYGRRYTAPTDQVQRSFEDTTLKQRALDLVLAS